MYLFFDTETTGLPRNYKAPVTDLNNWPRLVQLAWLFYDESGNKIAGNDIIIKPEGFTIPVESSRIHGISTERAMREGVSLTEVLQEFQIVIDQAESALYNLDCFQTAQTAFQAPPMLPLLCRNPRMGPLLHRL